MDPNQIMRGKYSLPFVLSIILGLIYKRTKISDELKPYISTVCGMLLGIGAMFYNEAGPITFVLVSDYIMAGGIGGAAATGIYEMNKQSPIGKTYIAIDSKGKKIQGSRVLKINKTKVIK